MVHNEEYNNNKIKFSIAASALIFCTVWALIGESDIRIVAVAIAFMLFLKYGVDTEMSSLSGDGGH